MNKEQRIKQIEERAATYSIRAVTIEAYVDGAKSMLPEIESLEARVKELEEERDKLKTAVGLLNKVSELPNK